MFIFRDCSENPSVSTFRKRGERSEGPPLRRLVIVRPPPPPTSQDAEAAITAATMSLWVHVTGNKRKVEASAKLPPVCLRGERGGSVSPARPLRFARASSPFPQVGLRLGRSPSPSSSSGSRDFHGSPESRTPDDPEVGGLTPVGSDYDFRV